MASVQDWMRAQAVLPAFWRARAQDPAWKAKHKFAKKQQEHKEE